MRPNQRDESSAIYVIDFEFNSILSVELRIAIWIFSCCHWKTFSNKHPEESQEVTAHAITFHRHVITLTSLFTFNFSLCTKDFTNYSIKSAT